MIPVDPFEITLSMPFKQALEVVEAALNAEGFGVVTRIDVQKTMRQKLNINFRPYVILGACNPPIAHRVLEHDPRMGLMLPCNVSVEAMDEDHILIRIADPDQMLGCGSSEDPVLGELASEARNRLTRVADRLRRGASPNDPEAKPWQRLNHLTD